MKISEHQFLLLGRELDRLLERVDQRILDLNTFYSSDRAKMTARGRTIQFEQYYGERDPRLWDALYCLTKSGIKFKSFQLPPNFVPMKEQMKDLDEKITPMKINR
jgi:hypothetical protein